MAASSPYYLNDTMSVSFQLTNIFGAVVPSSVTVDVYNPAGTKVVNNAAGTIQNTNEILYVVDAADAGGNVTLTAGVYEIFFEIVFADSTRRTHKETRTVTTRKA